MRVLGSRVFAACAASIATALVVGGTAWALQSPVDGSGVVHACYSASTGAISLNVKGSCPARGKTTPITWNSQGPQGPKGDTGPQGDAGPPGPPAPSPNYLVASGTLADPPARSSGTLDVPCPPGYRVTGGGYTLSGPGRYNVEVTENHRELYSPDPTEYWHVVAESLTGSVEDFTLDVEAYCVSSLGAG